MRRVDDDADEFVVLGRGPGQGNPADIDLLERWVQLERIEVGDDQFYRLDVVLVEVETMGGIIGPRQDCPMDPRVQCFDSPAEDLGESGEIADRGHCQTRVGQSGGGATGADEIDAAGGEAAAKLDQPGLVVNGDQGPRNRRRANPIERSVLRRLVGWREGRPRLGDEVVLFDLNPVVQGRFVIAGKNRHRPLGDDRAVIDLLVDEVDGHARDLDPGGQRLRDRVETGEGRQRGGMDVDDPIGKTGDRFRSENPHEASKHESLRSPRRLENLAGENANGRRCGE